MSDHVVTVLVALITIIPTTLGVLVLWLQGRNNRKENKKEINEIHIAINSRMTELLNATKGESKAEGKAEGKLEERDEVKQREVTKVEV